MDSFLQDETGSWMYWKTHYGLGTIVDVSHLRVECGLRPIHIEQ
jgi:hypothetical protein